MLGVSLGARGYARGVCLLAAGLLAVLAGGMEHASARSSVRTVEPREKAAPKAHGPILAVISIARQRISVYSSEGLIAHSAVSTGMAGHRTPTGVFTVISKNRWHQSNIYSGAPMPYMQRITWSGVAMHAGVVPGYPASHGCIRLPERFAAELWGITKLGARVVVAPDDADAVEISSPRLPLPNLVAAEADTAAVKPDKPELVSVAMSGQSSEDSGAAPGAVQRLLNPQERAKAAKIRTAADAQVKAKAAREAVALSAAKAAQANKAIAALRTAEQSTNAARARLEAATKALDTVKTPEAAERAKAAVTAAEAKLAEATASEDEARAQEAIATPDALTAARAAWEAETASTQATAAAKAADKGADPISIFISKKTGRLYIRQAWAPIYEAAVTFKDPDSLIGTHTYLAVEPAADSKSLRWLAVTSPPARVVRDDDDDDDRPRSRRAKAVQAEPAARHSNQTAAGALERIEMPDEARQFISDRLWTGAALIISDQGISSETGAFTDFIVLTR